MKLHVMSDLHLEFGPLELPGGETLLLAGDVCVADIFRKERTDGEANYIRPRFETFFQKECAKYDRVFYIAGNHEHYHGEYTKTFDLLREAIKGTNIQFLDNEHRELDDKTVLFGGTLWTDFNDRNWHAMDAAKRGMNDFYCVTNAGNGTFPKGRRLHPEDVADENAVCFETLNVMMRDVFPDKEFVVMTHHAPTPSSSHPKFGGSTNLLNYAYHNNYAEWLLDNPRVKYWFHGHTHDCHDYMVGATRVVCNPRGYYGHAETLGFDVNKNFEV